MTEKLTLVQEQVRKFLAAELLPIVDQINEDGIFPEKVYRNFFKAGFGASFLPEEWGGDGDILGYLDIGAEIGRIDLGFALSVMASAVLFGKNVHLLGTDAQKKQYLPGIVDGSKIGCWALTDPTTGGSDAVGIQTFCEKKGGQYILNGAKTFITNAPVADYFIIISRMKGTEGKGIEGGCAFVVERGAAGMTLGKPLKKMGHRTSPTGEIFLENCAVPASALLGTEGRAFLDMKKSLDFERAAFSAIGIGAIDELLNIMIKYAAMRNVFGKPILEYQLIQEKIAQIGAEFDVMKAYTQVVRDKMVKGERMTKEAAIVKLLLSKLGLKAADEAIQILGGYGYMTEYRVERIYRDMRLYEIGGGTSEIQKLVIAKELAKEYMNRPGALI
ncbi:MAG: acyl-CoA/acyl-ACP dehydrogenase [Deltaproteobacteria bacterium]|nr:acyl-CoA/acyl-ACP dehydrogenase [Deltaproteobacteria bacterium]